MLVRLSLENFFFIRGEELYFDKGLNVITGETGTGKSLTISSLLFLMGEEGNYPDGTCVEVELFSEGESTVLRRETLKGRSRYYLNGRGSTKKVVGEILSSSLLMQGQNDRLRIIRADFQRDVYDRFIGALEIRSKVEETYQEVMELREKLKHLREKSLEREVRKRMLEEELREIEELGITPEGYESIKERLRELNLAEKINRMVLDALSGFSMVTEGLRIVSKSLRDLLAYRELSHKLKELEGIRESLFDMEREVKRLFISYSQEELNSLNEKAYKVQRIERKYGKSFKEVWEYTQKIKEELQSLQKEEDMESLQKQLDAKEEELEKLYEVLTQKRQEGKEAFENKIKQYLESMGLEKASFVVSFEEKRGRYGKEQVKFLFSSYGKEEKELSQVASGGEISRLSLALFMLSPPAQTYVLDEIDTGISGNTSIKLAKMLRKLSRDTQLIVITHSPAIASAADKHFITRKDFIQDIPLIRVKELREKERPVEIARLMGKVNSNTIQGAEELIREICNV